MSALRRVNQPHEEFIKLVSLTKDKPIQCHVALGLTTVLCLFLIPTQVRSEEDPVKLATKDGSNSQEMNRKLLTTDAVDLEFKIKPTTVTEKAFESGNFNRQEISQQMGMGTGFKLGESMTLSHDYLVGASQGKTWADLTFEEREKEKIQQKNITSLQNKITDKLTLKLNNEVTQDQTSGELNGSQNVKQSAALDYTLPLGIGVTPEVSQEAQRNDAWQETERTTAALSLKKDIIADKLSIQARPHQISEVQHRDTDINTNTQALDLNLAWKPDSNFMMQSGANFKNLENQESNAQESQRGVYTQLSYALWSDLSLGARSDLQTVDKMQGSQELSDSQTQAKISFGPTLKLNDDFTAGAELGYRTQIDNVQLKEQDEQTLSLSVKGKF